MNPRCLRILCVVFGSLSLSYTAVGRVLGPSKSSGTASRPTLRAVVTDHGHDHLTVRLAFSGIEADQWSGPEFDGEPAPFVQYVAVPDCDAIDLDYNVHSTWHPGQGWSRGTVTGVTRGREGARIVGVSRMRNQAIAVLALDPSVFAGRQGTESRIDVRLRFRNARGSEYRNMGPVTPLMDRLLVHGSGDATRAFKNVGALKNYSPGQVTWATGDDWTEAAQSAIAAGTDYLVIMADELSDSLVEQLALKRANFNGLNVTIVKMSQIDTTPDHETTPVLIRNLIKDVYDSRRAAHASDSLLSHVLLIGDAVRPDQTVIIPSYYGFTGEHFKACDSYYSLLSEENVNDDYFPDVLLGRLPADAASSSTPPDPDWELRNAVSKILRYEQDGSLGRKVLTVSGGNDEGFPPLHPYLGYLRDRFSAYAQIDTLNRLDYPNVRRALEPTDSVFSVLVADRLNTDDYWVLAYVDHGNPYYLVESFFAKDYDILQTQNSLPLALLVGSDVGRFDLPAFNNPAPNSYGCLLPSATMPWQLVTPSTELDSCDVIPERLVLQENGSIGAIAFSRTTDGPYAVNAFTSMFRAIFEENAYSLGEILMATRLLMYPSTYNGSLTSVERNLTSLATRR